MAETHDQETVSGKKKTTYNRNHPTDNPKPPKHSRAKIQKAAQDRKNAQEAKKMTTALDKHAKEVEAQESRKLSAQCIAAAEDTVQRSQKECQLHSEHPDIQTMETYEEALEEKRKAAAPEDHDDDQLAGGTPDDDMYGDEPDLPPESTIDTDSDGVRLGMSDVESEDDIYKPSDDEREDDEDDVASDALMKRLYTELQLKKKEKKAKKAKGKLQAEVHARREVAPTVYAQPDEQLLNRGRKEGGSKVKGGKAAAIGGLHSDWQQHAQVPSRPQPPLLAPAAASIATSKPGTSTACVTAAPSNNTSRAGATAAPSTNASRAPSKSCARPADGAQPVNDGELGVYEEEEVLAAVRKEKQASAGASKKVHKGGTQAMGIKLKKVDITAIKASGRAPAKLRWKNSHLPFENPARDLQRWRDGVIPEIIDWVGTLEELFAANLHPDLPHVIYDVWKEEFPEILSDDTVLGVASAAIRNYRSRIGKHALTHLDKIFKGDEYKHSKTLRKEYVETELKNLAFTYRDPIKKSGVYRSEAIIGVFAFHQQIISKTDTFNGHPVGALSLCAAAHERALKLWRMGDGPTKETKTSFVRNPWAIRAAAHYKVVAKLSERVWDEINEAATAVLGLSTLT